MPGRTWVIAPDRVSLERRWDALQSEASPAVKATLFHPHPQGDKHLHKPLRDGLRGHEFRAVSVASDAQPVIPPVRYACRSFDRQWIIPDGRLINRPNPTLWQRHSSEQVYMTALHRYAPTSGPAVTFSAAIPDLDHYKGSFGGRVFPLWADRQHRIPNLKAALLRDVAESLGVTVSAPDMMTYFAGRRGSSCVYGSVSSRPRAAGPALPPDSGRGRSSRRPSSLDARLSGFTLSASALPTLVQDDQMVHPACLRVSVR